MEIHEINRQLVQAIRNGEDTSTLRTERVHLEMPHAMCEKEIIRAINTVTKEEGIEGDEFMALLDAVRRQESQAAVVDKPLVEKAIRLAEGETIFNADGTVPICIATPGWGSSGYYGEALLKEDGVNVFKLGLHSFWDHEDLIEAHTRPERSLRDLAGVLAENARWEDQGFNGPGLYSSVKVWSPYREQLEEMAAHIGMSMVVYGTSHTGTVDGETGDIIDSFVAARSVDFVTLPGRGGAVQAKFESLRKEGAKEKQTQEPQEKQTTFHLKEAQDLSHDAIRDLIYDALKDKYTTPEKPYGPWPREVYDDYVIFAWDGKTWKANYVIDKTGDETTCNVGDATEVVAVWEPVSESTTYEEVEVTDAEKQALEKRAEAAEARVKELETTIVEKDKTITRQAESLVQIAAEKFAEKALSDVKNIPDVTKARLAKESAKNPPIKDGKLDTEEMTKVIESNVKEHAEYLESIGYGGVKDLGPSHEENESTDDKTTKRLESAFASIGMEGDALKTASEGR